MIQSRPGETRTSESVPIGQSTGNSPKERFGRETEEMRRRAGDTLRETGEKVRESGEKLRDAGRRTKDELVRSTRNTTAQVQERASEMIADRKSRAADEVGVFGQALHRAADTLDGNDEGRVGAYVHQAADMVDSCADWLRDQEPADMLRSCGNFTRRHPEIVLGGLFVAGIAAARFLKASDRKRETDDADFELRDRTFEGNFGEGLSVTGGLSDMREDFEPIGEGAAYGTGLGNPSVFGGLSDDTDGGLAVDPTSGAEMARSASNPSLDSPPPVDSPNPVRDDDLNTIGRNPPTSHNPSRPR